MTKRLQTLLIICVVAMGISAGTSSGSTTSDEWGPVQNGLKTRLIPLNEQYLIGQPMKFRLEMTNVGDSAILYGSSQVAVNDSMIVKVTDGKNVPYIGGMCQTGLRSKPINPGEIVTLFDQLDITSQYYIAKPNRYTIQYSGKGLGIVHATENADPTAWSGSAIHLPSNVLEIEVQPGTPSPIGIVVGRLLPALPEKWHLATTRKAKSSDDMVTPTGRESAKGIYVVLLHYGKDKSDAAVIRIWQVDREVDISTQEMTQEPLKDQRPRDKIIVSEYLGKSPWGHVYVEISPKAKTRWPGVREKIITALAIHPE